MGRNIFIVTDRKNENAIGNSLLDGLLAVGFRRPNILMARNYQESITKLEDENIEVVICEESITKWRELSRHFKTSINKLFILIGERDDALGDPDVDRCFCLKSIRHNSTEVCKIIKVMMNT